MTDSEVKKQPHVQIQPIYNSKIKSKNTGPGSIQLVTLEGLNFSVRTLNCFKNEKIFCLDDLVKKTKEDLFNIRNFGKKCFYEVEKKLAEIGLHLDMGFCEPNTALLNDNIVEKHDERFFRLLMCVEEIDFSTRSLNCFKKNNIVYVGDLIQKTKKNLFEMRNLGKNCICEILSKLNELGLHLGMSVPEWDLIEKAEERKKHKDEIEKRRFKQSMTFYNSLGKDFLNLEEELDYIANCAGEKRNKEIIIKFYGWDGKGTKTLEAVGEEFKISRERVRQIANRFQKKLNGQQEKLAYLPRFDTAIKLISQTLPSSAEAIEQKLICEGLTSGHFNIEGLLSAAHLLKREVAISLVELNKKIFVVKPSSEKIIKFIVFFSKKAISKQGVSNLSEIAAQTYEQTKEKVDLKTVSSTLGAIKGFGWLDKENGWFWINTVPRNRLINQIKKILSVSGKIEIGEMRSSIGRFQRMEGFSPPRRVLIEICKQLSWCNVEGTYIEANPPLDWRKVLEGTEFTMAKILKEQGPIMGFRMLEKACLETGMNKNTFIAYLYSPILTRYALGVYGLCGTKTYPGIVDSLTVSCRDKIFNDFGWTDEGRIWVALQLKRGTLRSGVFYIPGNIHKYLQGVFELVDAEENFINNIKIKKHTGWSLNPFLGRRGGDIDDYLVLIFDLAKRKVKAYIGEKDLVEDFQQNGKI